MARKTSVAARLPLRSNSSTIRTLPKLLAPGGRFILGHTKRDTLTLVAPWREVKALKHGDSLMRFLEIVAAAT